MMNWINQLRAWLTGLTDEQAMARVQQDDQDAFAELVRRWERPIRDLCIRMTGNEQAGEDVAQETFARIFAQRRRYESGRKFSTWLWRIALNLCRDHYRQTSRRAEFPLDDETDMDWQALGPAPDEEVIVKERTTLVREALASLPETHRVVLVLREYEGLKLREIAEVLDIPQGTAKSRLADSLLYLARRLKPIFEHETSPRLARRNLEKTSI